MKILILGSVGSGKTTFSKKISKILNIKCYEIDSIVHDDIKGIKRSKEEQLKIFNKINKSDWILEGTKRSHNQYMIDNADIIYLLDVNKYKRLYRIIKRYIKNKLGIEYISYKVDLNILKLNIKYSMEYELTKEDLIKELEKTGKLKIIKN